MISKQQDEYYKIFLDQQQWHYIGQDEGAGRANAIVAAQAFSNRNTYYTIPLFCFFVFLGRLMGLLLGLKR